MFERVRGRRSRELILFLASTLKHHKAAPSAVDEFAISFFLNVSKEPPREVVLGCVSLFECCCDEMEEIFEFLKFFCTFLSISQSLLYLSLFLLVYLFLPSISKFIRNERCYYYQREEQQLHRVQGFSLVSPR